MPIKEFNLNAWQDDFLGVRFFWRFKRLLKQMPHELAKRRSQVKNTDSLKVTLLEFCDGISQEIKEACQSFVKRLQKVIECEDEHTEAYL